MVLCCVILDKIPAARSQVTEYVAQLGVQRCAEACLYLNLNSLLRIHLFSISYLPTHHTNENQFAHRIQLLKKYVKPTRLNIPVTTKISRISNNINIIILNNNNSNNNNNLAILCHHFDNKQKRQYKIT